MLAYRLCSLLDLLTTQLLVSIVFRQFGSYPSNYWKMLFIILIFLEEKTSTETPNTQAFWEESAGKYSLLAFLLNMPNKLPDHSGMFISNISLNISLFVKEICARGNDDLPLFSYHPLPQFHQWPNQNSWPVLGSCSIFLHHGSSWSLKFQLKHKKGCLKVRENRISRCFGIKAQEFSAGSGAFPKLSTFHKVALLPRFFGAMRKGSLSGNLLSVGHFYMLYPLPSHCFSEI